MSDFNVGLIAGLIIGACVILFVSYNIKPEDLTTLSSKCETNKGTENINIQSDKLTVKCKDGASFKIDR